MVFVPTVFFLINQFVYFNIKFVFAYPKYQWNKFINSIYYDKKEILDNVDYVVKFNDICEEDVNKYIEYNGIKNFDIAMCDYKNYGFRGVKICLNSKNIIK